MMTFAEESQTVFLSMLRDGGSFVKHLGELGIHADFMNRQRIKAAWPELWRQYSPEQQHVLPDEHC